MNHQVILIIILSVCIYPIFIDGLKRVLKDLMVGATYVVALIIRLYVFIVKLFKRHAE